LFSLPSGEWIFFCHIFFLRAVAQGRDYFFNQSFIISSCPSSSLPKFLNRASMVGQIAPSATTATNVRLGQRHRKSVVLPRAQRVQQDLQHQKEQEIQLASLVLRENFKRRTQRMKWFARNVKQDSSLTALTPWSAKHVIQESIKTKKKKQHVSHAFRWEIFYFFLTSSHTGLRFLLLFKWAVTPDRDYFFYSFITHLLPFPLSSLMSQ